MISVVVPAYNAAATIVACVQALQQQAFTEPYEIIVVDDGSTDETAVLAQQCGVTIIKRSRGRPAAARNSGIRAANGTIVCCTDADCIPAPNWLRELIAPFTDPNLVAAKGSYATQQSQLVARFVQLEYEDKYDLLAQQPTIDFIDTYSAAYRRDVLLANDGFDEQFPYLEDQELSFRLAARGYKMVFQPTAVVVHRHSHTLARYIRKKAIIGYWKAQVVRRFPQHGVKDSHTPQVMKLQMGLMGLLLATLPLLLLTPWAALLTGGVLLTFLLTTLPFVAKAWGKDRIVALTSPLLLAARALALGAGYGCGLVYRQNPRGSAATNTISGPNYLFKRFLDIVGSVFGLLLTAVMIPILALAIKLDSPGPVIFRQQRVGQGGRPFTVYKFRSMHVNAETMAEQPQSPEPPPKRLDDPRLTRVGRWLRRWSLDELPQFWNVLKGEMSLVGPRPEELRLAQFYNDWHRRRLAVKPGITGPMQVSGRGNLSLDQRVQLELAYIDHYSLGRDLLILLQTIPAVIKGEGAR
ncbi:MAG: sugar transferase [Anaerolineales bacterium]|nr:sugar transferase [Anaerolineales bacterium]